MACLGLWFLILEYVDIYALHQSITISYIYIYIAFLVGTILSPYFLLFALRKILHVFYGDDRKSTSSGCFSVLVNSKKKKKLGDKMQNFSFFFLIAFQISYVFLPDIFVHCALIKYAYI
jgi:hypothetical protein